MKKEKKEIEKKDKKNIKNTKNTKKNKGSKNNNNIKKTNKKTEKLSFEEKVSNFKDNPKQSLINFLKNIKSGLSNNRLFIYFVILNVLNGALLRSLTMGFDNFLHIDAMLADMFFILIVGSFCYFFNEKGKFIYLLIVTIFLSAICVLNSSYYTFYTSFSSISLLATARFITDVGDAVVENVLQPKDLIYVITPLLFILIRMYLKRKEFYVNSSFYKKNKLCFGKIILISILPLALFCCTLTGTDISRLTKQWNREYVVSKFGIYVYHVNDLIKSIEPKFAALFGYDSALREFNEFYSDVKKPATNEYTAIFEGKNIITIHGESMQNFLIGLKFNGVEVTPNLNKLAAQGMYFDNFYSQVSVGTSSDTEFTLNTSLMPAVIGTAFSDYADKEYVSIPKLLKEKGYYSFAMHGNNGEYWNRRIMHKNLGYDRLIAKDEFEIDDVIGLGLSDVSFFRQSVEKLKEINEEYDKFYGTFIMLTNHTPFSETDKYLPFDVDMKLTRVNEDGVEEEVSYPYMEGTKLGNYFKSAHYADYALGLFIEELEKEGLLDNTVLIFYGDHDARLPRKDYVRLFNYDPINDDILSEDDPNYVVFDEYSYELYRKVPFIIYSSETKENPQTISYTMGMYDVMPTLGNMFGFYNKYALGHDIFNTKDDNIVIFPTGNWVTKDIYYNHQKEEAYVLSQAIIGDDTIKNNSDYTDKILSVSNNILVYNLIKNSNLDTVNEQKIIKGS